MTSVTKLRRRLNRWQRYDDRNQQIAQDWDSIAIPPGLWRARNRWLAERNRRRNLARPVETDWCWACGEDDCGGDCEPETVLRPAVDEPAFARLGIL